MTAEDVGQLMSQRGERPGRLLTARQADDKHDLFVIAANRGAKFADVKRRGHAGKPGAVVVLLHQDTMPILHSSGDFVEVLLRHLETPGLLHREGIRPLKTWVIVGTMGVGEFVDKTNWAIGMEDDDGTSPRNDPSAKNAQPFVRACHTDRPRPL